MMGESRQTSHVGKQIFLGVYVSGNIYCKVALLDFSEGHHPNFEQLILYCLSSVGQAASHIY